MANKHDWNKDAACLGFQIDLFFDRYENEEHLRPQIEDLCSDCPIARQCFAIGVSQKEWGVWGGIYLENGKISREFNKHRTKQNWAQTWQRLVTD